MNPSTATLEPAVHHAPVLTQLLRSVETYVWLLLMTLTFTSWVVGANVGGVTDERTWGIATLMALAFFKVWLVVRYFMETRHAPWELKWSCEAYVWASFVAVTGYTTGYFH
ncbi:MAG TPA: cytochrome C oxidase subunit IV family protein [Macromonas sp.]|nr:cytochrome C oxidase subunit IV family protein [Macromonas sp.]